MKPTSRSLTTDLPKMRFQFTAMPQKGLFAAEENDSGITVAKGADSNAWREYRTYNLSSADAFQSTFTSNWSTCCSFPVTPL